MYILKTADRTRGKTDLVRSLSENLGPALAVNYFLTDQGSRKKRYRISVMTKNEEMFKKSDCPKGWTIKQ